MVDEAARVGRSVRSGRVIRLVILGSSVVLLFALPFPTLIAPDLRRVLLVVAIITGGIGWLQEARSPRLPGALVAVLGASLLMTALSAWSSDHPSTAFFGLWLSAAYSGIAVLAWRSLQREEARTEAMVVVGLGGFLLVTGTYLVNVADAWIKWSSLGMELSDVPLRPAAVGGIVPGPVWTSDYALLLAPLAVLAPVFVLRRGRAAAHAIIASLALATVAIAAIRALWAATAIVLIAVVIGWAWQRRTAMLDRRWRIIGALITVLAAIGLGAIATAPRLGGLLRDADEGRVAAFRAAIEIFGRYPIFGSGPGSYATLRMGYPAERLSQLALPDPHNGILAAMSDTGVTGLITLVLTAVVIGIPVFRSLRDLRGPVAVAACAGFAIVLLHRMVDMVFVLPGMMIAGIVVVGIAMGLRPALPPDGWRRAVSLAFVGVALALTVASAPRLVAAERGFDAYRAAASDWEAGDVASAGEGGHAALVDAPDFVPAYRLMSMIALRQDHPEQAVTFETQAAEREPMPQNLARLAAALWSAGRRDEAADVISRAAGSLPEDPIVFLNGIAMGRPADRPTMLVRLLALEPEVAAFGGSLPAVSAAEFATGVEAAHRDLLASGMAEMALRLSLAAERRDLAEAAIDVMAGASREIGSLLASGWFGDSNVATDLDAIASADPAIADRAAYLLAVRSCRQAGARRWAEVIRIRTGESPRVLVGVGPESELMVGDPPSRYPGWIWGVADLTPAYPDAMWTIDRREGVTCREP